MADPFPSLSVVIVNYNAGEALVDCVRAVLDSSVPANIHVVDNASGDGSLSLLEKALGSPDALVITCNEDNRGFAPAVNQAAREADSEYLLILNPDCVLEPLALERLLRALDRDPVAALAGPLVRDSRGEREAACLRRFPRPWDSFVSASGLHFFGRWFSAFRGVAEPDAENQGKTIEAEATSGACMLVRRAALAEVGYLDETYTLHFEDLDLMYRLKQAGWRCLFVPAAEARHLQGISSRHRPVWVHWQKHRGMTRFYRKNLAAGYPFPVGLMLSLGTWAHFLVTLPVAWLKR